MVLKLVVTNFVVRRGFYRHVAVDEEGVAQFNGGVEQRLAVIFASEMVAPLQFSARADKDAVALEIVTRSSHCAKGIYGIFVVVTQVGTNQKFVVKEVTPIEVDAEVAIAGFAVAPINVWERGSDIFLTLFKLRVGAKATRKDKGEWEQNLLHGDKVEVLTIVWIWGRDALERLSYILQRYNKEMKIGRLMRETIVRARDLTSIKAVSDLLSGAWAGVKKGVRGAHK